MERKSITLNDSLEVFIQFALERKDIQQLVKGLLQTDDVSPVTMEYELQLLRILTVGWGISYFLGDAPEKNRVLQSFWNRINELSKDISEALLPSLGNDFDYFSIVKQRLDQYVKIMDENADVSDPGVSIGPLFAEFCGDATQNYLILSGKAVFHLSLGDVKKYLSAVVIRIDDEQ